MNRIEFTDKISKLLVQMISEGETPIGDFWKRSDEEQMHLYQMGKTKCDGIKNISKHQIGCALDIYFPSNGKLVNPKKGWDYWHSKWEELGGKPIISWDKDHFEG